MISLIEKLLLRLIETVCLLLLVMLAGCVIYATTMRYLGASPAWYDEVASVLLAWLTYFGATYAVFMRQHMGFSGLVTALPARYAVGLALVSELLVLSFFLIVAWFGWAVLSVAGYDSLVSLPWLTLDIVQSVVPITSVLMILGTLLTMPQVLRDAAAGIDREHEEINHAIADAETGARAYSGREVRQ